MHQSWFAGVGDSFVFMPRVNLVFLSVLCRTYTKGGRASWHSLSMVTAKAQYNLRNAKRYFGEHLSAGDYYQARQKNRDPSNQYRGLVSFDAWKRDYSGSVEKRCGGF